MAKGEEPVSLFLLKALKKEGIDHVFLVPGFMIRPFFNHFSKVGIEPIVAAKEDGAAYMADGYGRIRQSFGVCMGIGGPGVTNMATPISAAYSDRSRVFAIAGSIEAGWSADGAFQDSSETGVHDVDIMNFMTAYAELLPDKNKINSFLKEAFIQMGGVENLPVFLSLPRNMLDEKISLSYTPQMKNEPPRIVDTVTAKKVIESLKNNSGIVMLVGNGSVWSQADEKIKEFAEQYHIPVVTTLRAKGAISEEHEMSFGVFGMGGSVWANHVIFGSEDLGVPRPELLLVLGATLNETNTLGWSEKFAPTKELVCVDINPNNTRGKEYNEHFVMGDVKTFLSWLLEDEQKQDFHENLMQSKTKRQEWTNQIKKSSYYYQEIDRSSNAQPINPARVIAELRNAAKDTNTILVVDSGAHTFFTGHHWKSFGPNQFLLLSTTGPMGYGIPMGIGAKKACEQRPCICVVGDGSMLMGGMELFVAVRYEVPLVVVVINNSGYGNVFINAKEEAERELAKLPDQDWAAFAKSLGALAERIEDPKDLAKSFERALKSKKPYLIDVVCDLKYCTPNT
ncbi:MAG: thiamine pyrophosphate-binding protein [Nitrosopumilaceae archaeon]